MQVVIAQNKSEHKGIPMRDIEPNSITYPVYLIVHATNNDTGMPYPGVYIFTEYYEYAWGEIAGIHTMATGLTDEIGYIEEYTGDPLSGFAMTYRMRIVVRSPSWFSAKEVDVPFQTGLTEVHILLSEYGDNYVIIKYNDGSSMQAMFK